MPVPLRSGVRFHHHDTTHCCCSFPCFSIEKRWHRKKMLPRWDVETTFATHRQCVRRTRGTCRAQLRAYGFLNHKHTQHFVRRRFFWCNCFTICRLLCYVFNACRFLCIFPMWSNQLLLFSYCLAFRVCDSFNRNMLSNGLFS